MATACAPSVSPKTLSSVVSVESGHNPFAIGVVDGRLVRQPTNLLEGIATARALERRGIRFSAGLGQIYVGNWARLGLDAETVFDPCRNLAAAAAILGQCFRRATKEYGDQQAALRAALSCYYSDNFTTGFAVGYVEKVVAAAGRLSVGGEPSQPPKRAISSSKGVRGERIDDE